MKYRRLAAIDIGTNSIRCIVVEVPDKGDFRVLDDEKATVRLGEGLAATGAISPAAIERAREALLRMRKIIDGLGVKAIEAVATSAVRKASNGQAFLAAGRVLLLAHGGAYRQGAPQEVITPENLRAVYGVDVRVAQVDGARVCVPML